MGSSVDKHQVATIERQGSDEIDLFQLWVNVKNQKKYFFITFFSVFLLGVLFAFVSPKIYQTSAKLLPPEQKDLSALAIPNVPRISSDAVYQEFVDNLYQAKLYLELANSDKFKPFFYADDSVTDFDVLTSFENILSIDLPLESKQKQLLTEAKIVEVSLDSKTAELSYDVLLHLIQASNEESKNLIKQNLLSGLQKRIDSNNILFSAEEKNLTKEINAEIERLTEKDELDRASINEQISSLKEKALRDRKNRIERLDEAYKMAKKLGITKPMTPVDYQSRKSTGNSITVETKSPVGYWLGTKILSAEIQILKNRKTDDAFISELSGLEEKLKRLEVNERIEILKKRKSNLAFSDKLRAYQKENRDLLLAIEDVKKAEFDTFQFMMQPAIPSAPIKPNKKLILLASIIMGLLLGILVALLMSAFQNRVLKSEKLALEQK